MRDALCSVQGVPRARWLAQGIRTQDEEHAMQIEHFAARVTELLETINALKKDRERLAGRGVPPSHS